MATSTAAKTAVAANDRTFRPLRKALKLLIKARKRALKQENHLLAEQLGTHVGLFGQLVETQKGLRKEARDSKRTEKSK